MSDVRCYEVTTDYGVMSFTSEDNVGYWWKQITGEMGMAMQPHQQRVIDEKAELDAKVESLTKFVTENPIFENVPADEQKRMWSQLKVMTQYSKILGQRIAAFPVS